MLRRLILGASRFKIRLTAMNMLLPRTLLSSGSMCGTFP
jgi:hypothetical protein